jgi:hypothetical protein
VAAAAGWRDGSEVDTYTRVHVTSGRLDCEPNGNSWLVQVWAAINGWHIPMRRPWLINPTRLSVGSSFRPPSSPPSYPPGKGPLSHQWHRHATMCRLGLTNKATNCVRDSSCLGFWVNSCLLNWLCVVNRHQTVRIRRLHNIILPIENHVTIIYVTCFLHAFLCVASSIHRSQHGASDSPPQSING